MVRLIELVRGVILPRTEARSAMLKFTEAVSLYYPLQRRLNF